eukprot:6202742-Pleurochrysis_carterae.AAC.1
MQRSTRIGTILLAGALAHTPTQQNLRRSSTTRYCRVVGLQNLCANSAARRRATARFNLCRTCARSHSFASRYAAAHPIHALVTLRLGTPCWPLFELALGKVWLRTAVYMFDHLIDSMLLSASFIVKHGLDVDDASMMLRGVNIVHEGDLPKKPTTR